MCSSDLLDLMRSSVQEGALQKASIDVEGKIQENAYQEQADAFTAQAGAAKMAGIGGIFGGLLKGAGALAALF